MNGAGEEPGERMGASESTEGAVIPVDFNCGGDCHSHFVFSSPTIGFCLGGFEMDSVVFLKETEACSTAEPEAVGPMAQEKEA